MHTLQDTTRAQHEAACEMAYAMFSQRDTFTGVDVGFRRVAGQPTKDLALRLHVTQKLPEAELPQGMLFPTQLAGMTVDVIETSHTAQRGPGRPTDRHAILTGGMSVGRVDDTAGTIGAIVIDNLSGRPALLSNWHVLAGGNARHGDPILQPSEADGGDETDTIATLSRWILDRTGDAAIAGLNGKRAWLPIQYGSKATVKTARDPQLGETLIKQGQTQEALQGRIDGEGIYRISYEVQPDVHEPRDIRGFMIATDKSEGEDTAREGDSGSLWLGKDDNAAVGLHCAGQSQAQADQVIACNMPSVLNALDARLATYEDLFLEAERLRVLECDPRGTSYDRYYAPMNDFSVRQPSPMPTSEEKRYRKLVPLLEDPRDLPAMMPVETMPEGLYIGAPYGIEDEDMAMAAIWRRLTETLQAEGYTLDPKVSPDMRIRDLINTEYPEYVLAGIIESSRHFRDWFDPLPTGAFYKSCRTLGQVCNKLAALHEVP